MESLHILNDKLDLLIKRYHGSQDEVKRLRTIIEGQNKTIDTLSKKVKNLENGIATIQISKQLGDLGNKDNVKKHLDGIILEIDKILLTLND